MKTLKIFEYFQTDTLRSRSAATSIAMQIFNIRHDEHIQIDFEHIIFASRSFCNELLYHLKTKKNVSFVNVNPNVQSMLNIALTKPEPKIRFSRKELII